MENELCISNPYGIPITQDLLGDQFSIHARAFGRKIVEIVSIILKVDDCVARICCRITEQWQLIIRIASNIDHRMCVKIELPIRLMVLFNRQPGGWLS